MQGGLECEGDQDLVRVEVSKSSDIQLKEGIIVLSIVGIGGRKERRRKDHRSNRSGNHNRREISGGSHNNTPFICLRP